MELAKKAQRFDGAHVASRDGPKNVAAEIVASDFPRLPTIRGSERAGNTSLLHWMETTAKANGVPTCKCQRANVWTSPPSSNRWPPAAIPNEFKRAWIGWHAVGAPMRQRYARLVELGNKGSRELGFADVGAIWRSNYDMPPDEFAKEVDRLWEQLRPLYVSLHAYVRGQLAKKYGATLVPAQGPDSRAAAWQYLGAGMEQRLSIDGFAQAGAKLRPDENPPGSPHRCASGMVRYGEGFFTSLGFAPLPKTFWERSLFTKPADRDVVCHASAWDVDSKDDLRIKMCIQITAEDFRVIHHELGHNFYQRAYNTQPPLVPEQRQRWIPRSGRRHHRALGHSGVSEKDRLDRHGSRRHRGISITCCSRRWRKWRSCRSAC